MILRNGKITTNTFLQTFTCSKNRTPNINLPVLNQICTRPSIPVPNSPSKFSTFNNCVKTGNATAARILNKSVRGYPKIYSCNAPK